MSKYFINIFFIIIASLPLSSQNQEKTNSNDSLVGFNQKYGIRVGFDLSRLGRTIFDSYYSQFCLKISIPFYFFYQDPLIVMKKEGFYQSPQHHIFLKLLFFLILLIILYLKLPFFYLNLNQI